MNPVTVELKGDVIELIECSPDQVERRVLELMVLELYRQHEISAGRAAEILGLDEFVFIRWAGSLGIPYFDTTPEDWERQLRVIEKE